MGAVTSSIAAKFAYFPPTPPSYTLTSDPAGKLRFAESMTRNMEEVEVVRLRTRRGNDVVAMYVRNQRAAGTTVLYSHGNAADLGQMVELFVELSGRLRVNLMGYDYSGYGQSTGKVNCPILVIHGAADEVVDWSHGKQLWELSKNKYDPLWLNGGGHCSMELLPDYIRHLKKFVSSLHKSKVTSDSGSKRLTSESDIQSKPPDAATPEDTFELNPDLAEPSRNSLDSQLDKCKKPNRSEKTRLSIDLIDRFRRRKGLIW